MKRYGFLYEKIYDIDNIRIAHENARKGKRHYREVEKIDNNSDKYLLQIRRMLKDKTFRNSEYERMIKETDSGKVREIYKLPYFPDRIVQHAIMNIVEPIWERTLIRDTYAAIKNRGIHDGVKRIKKALRNKEDTQYCLKMDVRKYYPSIDNKILKIIIRKKIKDPDLLWLLDQIIDSTEGVPIGNYLSQYLGNLYLSGYDHWIKERKRVKYYFRYCDDIVILASNKERLHELRKATQDYLNRSLKLKIKGNYQVFPLAARGLDFLGYKFYHSHTLLRKSIAKKFKRKMKYIKKNWKIMNDISIVSTVMSYIGWLQHANCMNLIRKHIDDTIFWIVKHACIRQEIANPLRGAL